MRVTTVLVTALLVATCGNNDARTIEDGGKQKLLWQTGLLHNLMFFLTVHHDLIYVLITNLMHKISLFI